MSLRQVLTIYRMERELNADDMALLNTIRRFTNAERETLIDGLSDKPQKKPSKKTAGKSRRASSLQQQIKTATNNPAIGDFADGTDMPTDGACAKCGGSVDNNVHHKQTDSDYHEFQPAEQAAGASGDRRS